MSLNIGNMRSQVSVHRRHTDQDTAGQQSIVWDVVGTTWAFIDSLAGKELESAQAIRADDTHVIQLRYYPGLTEKDRFVYIDPEGAVRYFNITSVIDLEMRHLYMQCTAAEGITDQ